ncbi:MAG: radical SAM protein [Theionarchaea archaeon]|nr:radical SAM protein [Theionarchaea archaeon]
MIIEEYEAKTVIRTSTPGLFSWSEVYLNPYQGCSHDCTYCDGKSEGYYMHEDFAERIRVKVNAPHLLEQYLRKKGFIPFRREKTSTLVDFIPSLKKEAQLTQPGKFILFIGGGVCDVYQPAEAQVKMTRKLLQIAYDYQFPVSILTKNRLVLRDLDLLKKISEDSHACCSFTITLADEKIQSIFEPKASTTQERFEAIKTLRKEGIHSGVYFYPVLPFIGDTNKNMQSIYEKVQKAGAEFVYCWGLTLKPGRNKEEFLQTVKRYFPSLLSKYQKLYGNNNKYGNVDSNKFKKMGLVYPEVKGYKLGYEYGLPYTAERYIPEGRITMNLQVSEVLIKIAYIKGCLLQHSQSDVRPLYQASRFLESYQKDISELTPKERETLPITKEVYPYVLEIINEKKSSYLEKLEEKAYKAVSDQLVMK